MKTLLILFSLLLVTELVASCISHKKIYTLKETLENLGIGVVSFSIDYGFSLVSYPLMLFVFQYYQCYTWQQFNAMYYLLAFVALDFIEYLFHYLSHKLPLFWAAHKVHHQSEFFNLSVGLRSSFLIPVFNTAFYLLLPLCGFHPDTVLQLIFIQGIYQLCIHTQWIKKLGVLDFLLVTPSVHRVHHGINDRYLDKNFGKVLTIWDHVFQTYTKETEHVIYGATHAEGEKGIIRAQLVPVKKWWKYWIEK
jgi:alkylglycerol monooxygenase